MHLVEEKKRTRLTAAARRESILEAAVQVFTANGYRAAKMSDVAAVIGVSEPVIFQNFGSKDALYAAVIDRVADGMHAEMADLIARHGSVPELLARVLSPSPHGAGHHPPAHRESGHHPPAHRALLADAAALVADPSLGEPARRAARALAGHLADLLRRGQADGDIRADLDPEAGAWLLLSVLSAQPLRAAAMPGAPRGGTPRGGAPRGGTRGAAPGEDPVAALALRALTQPAPRAAAR